MGPLTEIAVTHRCGELCRVTGSHFVSFISVDAFPRTQRQAEGFLVFGGRFYTDTQSDSSKTRVFGAHVKSSNFFRSGLGLALRCRHYQLRFTA